MDLFTALLSTSLIKWVFCWYPNLFLLQGLILLMSENCGSFWSGSVMEQTHDATLRAMGWTRCNCCVKCCRSRTCFYSCHIVRNIARNVASCVRSFSHEKRGFYERDSFPGDDHLWTVFLKVAFKSKVLIFGVFFKCSIGLYDFNIFQWVQFKDFTYSVRNSERRLAKGRFMTDVFKFSYFNRIVDLWNNLPLFIRKCTSYAVFKKESTKHYKHKFLQNASDFYNHF